MDRAMRELMAQYREAPRVPNALWVGLRNGLLISAVLWAIIGLIVWRILK